MRWQLNVENVMVEAQPLSPLMMRLWFMFTGCWGRNDYNKQHILDTYLWQSDCKVARICYTSSFVNTEGKLVTTFFLSTPTVITREILQNKHIFRDRNLNSRLACKCRLKFNASVRHSWEFKMLKIHWVRSFLLDHQWHNVGINLLTSDLFTVNAMLTY